MLANGALAIEDQALSKRLIGMSTALIPSIFAECDIYSTSAYFLMFHYYMRIGDISQAWICVEFTKGLIDILVMKSPQSYQVQFLKRLCALTFEKSYSTL